MEQNQNQNQKFNNNNNNNNNNHFDDVTFLNQQCGLFADFKNDSIFFAKPYKSFIAPCISYIKSTGTFIIYYSLPKEQNDLFGQQHFEFDGNAFNFAYFHSRNMRGTPKDEYTPFDFLFFDQHYSNANDYVRAIFKFYALNPSFLNKISKQNKKCHKKAQMPFKIGNIRKAFNLPNKKQIAATKIALNKPKYHSQSTITSDALPLLSLQQQNNDQQLELDLKNMNIAINKAAKSFDLNSFFPFYLDSYMSAFNLKSVSNKKYKEILEKFVKSVDELQKKCYNN